MFRRALASCRKEPVAWLLGTTRNLWAKPESTSLENRRKRMQPVVSLYRRLLRLHRQKLTATKRTLGDQYLKKEFRDHRTAKPEFIRGFVSEWSRYADELEKRGDVGSDLPKDVVETLSPEQKQMLAKLRKSTQGLK